MNCTQCYASRFGGERDFRRWGRLMQLVLHREYRAARGDAAGHSTVGCAGIAPDVIRLDRPLMPPVLRCPRMITPVQRRLPTPDPLPGDLLIIQSTAAAPQFPLNAAFVTVTVSARRCRQDIAVRKIFTRRSSPFNEPDCAMLVSPPPDSRSQTVPDICRASIARNICDRLRPYYVVTPPHAPPRRARIWDQHVLEAQGWGSPQR